MKPQQFNPNLESVSEKKGVKMAAGSFLRVFCVYSLRFH